MTTVDSNNHTVWMRTQQLNRHHIAWKHSKAINQSQTASKHQQTLKRLIWKDLRDRYRQQTRENFWCALAYYSMINQAFRNQGHYYYQVKCDLSMNEDTCINAVEHASKEESNIVKHFVNTRATFVSVVLL